MWTGLEGSLIVSAVVLGCEESLVVCVLLGSIPDEMAFVMEPLCLGLVGAGERLKG